MIENQQKVNKIQQHIKKIRLQVDIKGQKKDKTLTKNHIHAPTIVFWAKISKEFDFQVFRNFGEIF